MNDIHYMDRITKQMRIEKVYGARALSLFYGSSSWAWLISFIILPLVARWSVFSRFYGYLQTRGRSRKKIAPFIAAFKIDVEEFADSVETFSSFNDFFIRKLKKESRPVDSRSSIAAAPVDGRYLVIDNVSHADGFYVKGQRFNLRSFLRDDRLSEKFQNGSMVIARLCPTDYHRFHFPISGIARPAQLIRGPLFSVNSFALSRRFSTLWENKRELTVIDSDSFGAVCMVEVGATCVGTIHQTFCPNQPVHKGEEKGFFSFGGSCVILLFEKNRIIFDRDLIENSKQNLETRCLFGTSIGSSLKKTVHSSSPFA